MTAALIAEAFLEALAQPTATLDDALGIVSANDRLWRMLAANRQRHAARPVALPAAVLAPLREALSRAEASGAGEASCEVEAELPELGRRVLVLRAARLGRILPGVGHLVLTIEDVTGRVSPPSVTGGSRALAAATHDLRQPLQTMTLLGSLLARRVGNPDLLPLIGRLEDTVRVMSGMLNTLLDIGRWDSGHARAEPANFVLDDLLDGLRGEFGVAMRAKGLDWRVVACRQMIHSDQRLLAQMLQHLVQYAADHSQHARLLLGVRRRGARLRIELWGSGVDPAAVHVAQDTWRRAMPGVAPGLAMVRRIADLLGHRIDVELKPGRGSVFWIEVPRVGASSPARPLAEPDRASRGTVFVIDDDAGVRETLRDLLEATGWSTESFASSEAFLAADRADRSGCLLIDALLPGMGGVDLLRTLKDRHSLLPAIILTGAGDVRMAVESMTAGALNFIEKPVRFDELLPSIERAFDLLADSSKLAAWRQSAQQRAATLTGRERQVLKLVLAGQPSRNIAADLGVSRRTVENHRAAIMKKMGAASIPALIRVGIAAS